jgi:hypothetical protein
MFGRRKNYCIGVSFFFHLIKTGAMHLEAVPSLFEAVDGEYWQ